MSIEVTSDLKFYYVEPWLILFFYYVDQVSGKKFLQGLTVMNEFLSMNFF